MTTPSPGPPRLPAFLADHPAGTRTIALVNGRVFDGRAMAGSVPVTIEAGRITRLGEAPPPGAVVLDLEGRFLMPGLIDAHAHLTMLEHSSEPPKVRKGAEPMRPGMAAHLVGRTLRRALRMGVTTIRDVGAYGDVLLDLRQAIRYGAFTAPRLLVCGRIVSATAPGARFFPDMYREADGPDDVRRAVREQIRNGADFVKIMSTGARSVELEDPDPSQVTAPEMAAFVEEAHRQGFRAAAHCEGLAGTRLAIEAGCDTIEHGFHLGQAPELLAQMAGTGQVLVPTLSFLHHVAESGAWVGMLEAQGEHNVSAAHATLQAAMDAKVTIAVGSDSPDPDGVALEIQRLVEHGMSVTGALSAATVHGARALGIEAAVGTVAPGMLADLVVVDGDVLADPSLLLRPANVWLVLRNGDPVAGSVLERSL